MSLQRTEQSFIDWSQLSITSVTITQQLRGSSHK